VGAVTEKREGGVFWKKRIRFKVDKRKGKMHRKRGDSTSSRILLPKADEGSEFRQRGRKLPWRRARGSTRSFVGKKRGKGKFKTVT